MLTFTFLFSNIINEGFASFIIRDKSSSYRVESIVYAAPKTTSKGFKSGSFSTPKSMPSTSKPKSSTGGFKSGSFSTPKSNGGSTGGSSTKSGTYNSNSSGSKTFIPIPIPFGRSSYSGSRYSTFGLNPIGWLFSSFFKFILFIIVIVLIVKIIKNSKKY